MKLKYINIILAIGPQNKNASQSALEKNDCISRQMYPFGAQLCTSFLQRFELETS